ncbi:MAG TPA: ABC transporter permease [Tepidisphaeraceae bacterium]|jgi:ABC-2 type transport system permease protein
MVLPVIALTRRELVRFLRQRNRVIGALATPILFWLLIGLGMGRSFAGAGGDGAGEGAGYLTYFFPGTILMILLFTAIFSTISVIEDRREGFLQGVLVAPVGRSAIVGGKVLGGAILATGQAVLFLLLGWATGVATLSPLAAVVAVAAMFLIAVGLTALGLCLAWRMESTQGFHAVMNLFLMPMWFLSGALFPIRDDTPLLFKAVMLANPLTYALAWLRRVLWAAGPATGVRFPWQTSMSVTIVFAVVMVAAALLIARSRTTADAT